MTTKENMKPFMLRVTAEQSERLAMLKNEGMTVSAWIRNLITKNLPSAEKRFRDLNVTQ